MARIESQIAALQGNLTNLKNAVSVKPKKEKKVKKEKPAPPPAPVASTSRAPPKQTKQAAAPAPAKKKNAASSSSGGGSKKAAVITENDALTFDQKRDLSEAIQKLEGSKLERVINIIHEGVPEIRDVRYHLSSLLLFLCVWLSTRRLTACLFTEPRRDRAGNRYAPAKCANEAV
jgi:hypothetical protein